MNDQSVTLAAQADLVLLTVDMLNSPRKSAESDRPLWFEHSSEQLDELLQAALGEASESIREESLGLTLRTALEDVVGCAQSLCLDDWIDEHTRMFDGATACPLNQASYIRRDKGKILGDVSAFYNAFGWRGRVDTGERPDHLICQLEFMAMLLALASRAPDSLSHEVVTDAMKNFARDHMHDWLPAVCWQMCEESQIEYYGAVAQWLLVLWQGLTEWHDWPIDQPAEHRLKPIVDPDEPYECGAPDLHQIQAKS